MGAILPFDDVGYLLPKLLVGNALDQASHNIKAEGSVEAGGTDKLLHIQMPWCPVGRKRLNLLAYFQPFGISWYQYCPASGSLHCDLLLPTVCLLKFDTSQRSDIGSVLPAKFLLKLFGVSG